jgi:hypothetical protein
MTLDRTLSYKPHLEKKTGMMVNSRVNLDRKLSGTKWGSGAHTLLTACIALVYSAAEYCASVWLNTVHVDKVDFQLNNALRLITGTVKSTPLQWLSVLTNNAPSKMRRETSLFLELKNCWSYGRSLLFDQLQVVSLIRLRSRFVIWAIDHSPLQDGYRIVDRWRESWLSNVPVNGDIVDDPSWI